MAVAIEQIQPGAVFKFKTAPRRVVRLGEPVGLGFDVYWEYADGKKRGGRLTGAQWVHYFREGAIEQIPDPAPAGESRQLLPSRRTVPSLANTVDITITTHCPAKWVMVDMQTGELWGHTGSEFRHLSAEETADVAFVARCAAN